MLDNVARAHHDASEELIRAHYRDFNARRLDAMLSRFAADAQIEQITGRVGQGPAEYDQFLRRFLEAFPDVQIELAEIQAKTRGFYEVRVIASGLHTGTLAFGTWLFRPTGLHVRLPARELFQIADGRIQFASVSFDLHDLVRQLASVDTEELLQHVARIHQPGQQLAQAGDNPMRKRELIDRLAGELDAARHVARPYFR
jgi:predicted ester cyclase